MSGSPTTFELGEQPVEPVIPRAGGDGWVGGRPLVLPDGPREQVELSPGVEGGGFAEGEPGHGVLLGRWLRPHRSALAAVEADLAGAAIEGEVMGATSELTGSTSRLVLADRGREALEAVPLELGPEALGELALDPVGCD
jgi:hypothetical protein